MPRRYSREWLIRRLSRDAAFAAADTAFAKSGDHGGYEGPGEWDEHFRSHSTDKLRTLAAERDLTSLSQKRGWRKGVFDWRFSGKLSEVKCLLARHSEQGACRIVAEKYGMDPDALRMRFRRTRKWAALKRPK
jgi:hypothetical protein